MTTAAAIDNTTAFQTARRPRPRGLDLAAARVGMALVLWARRHAERVTPSPEQHALQQSETRARELRETRERDAGAQFYLR